MTEHQPLALATEVNQQESDFLKKALEPLCELRTIPGTLAEVDLKEFSDVEILLPFIHSKVDRETLEAMPRLKVIATRSTGYDHIDMKTAREKGIVVANVPGYGETAVAEYTFALLLTISRKVDQAVARTKSGDYNLAGLRGFDLYGKTIGVVGAGAIGLRVIRIAAGFGMRVLAFDMVHNRLLAEVLNYRYVGLDELLKESDIISLHAPALPSTYHMINRESLSKMKRGVFLINTARGSLINTRDLAWALDEQIVAGVGLDALEGEEFLEREEELLNQPGAEEKLRVLVQNNMLSRRANVVITPHVAFNSVEALQRILDTTIENVQAFLAGNAKNIVKV